MRNRSLLTTFAVTVSAVGAFAIPAATAVAQPVGSGGTGSQGCLSQEGIPLDHGQGVILGDTTISCNNGTVCMTRANVTFCYYAPDSTNPGLITVPTKPRIAAVQAAPIAAKLAR